MIKSEWNYNSPDGLELKKGLQEFNISAFNITFG